MGKLLAAMMLLLLMPSVAFASPATNVIGRIADMMFSLTSMLIIPLFFMIGGWKIAMNAVIYVLGFDPLAATGLPIFLNKDAQTGRYIKSARDYLHTSDSQAGSERRTTGRFSKMMQGLPREDVDDDMLFYVGRSKKGDKNTSFGDANLSILKDMGSGMAWIIFAWTAVGIVKLLVAGVFGAAAG